MKLNSQTVPEEIEILHDVLQKYREHRNLGTFSVSAQTAVERFLIYGGASYQVGSNVSRAALPEGVAGEFSRILSGHGESVVYLLYQISTARPVRAPRNSYAAQLLGFAAARGNPRTKMFALKVLPLVCRIPTDLNIFINCYKSHGGGWGRAFKRAIAHWYVSKTPSKLAWLLTKYNNREGWTHRDIFRLAHINPNKVPFHSPIINYFVNQHRDSEVNAMREKDAITFSADFRFADTGKGLTYLCAIEAIKEEPDNISQIINLIKEFSMPFQVLPTALLKRLDIWLALLPTLGYTGLLRNTRRFYQSDFFSDEEFRLTYISLIADKEALVRQRIHPFLVIQTYLAFYNAISPSATYSYYQRLSGKSAEKQISDSPENKRILKELGRAFFSSFGNVTPLNKRIFIALDISGSMVAPIMGTNLSCAQAAAFIAYYYARTESEVRIYGFSSGPRDTRRWSPMKTVLKDFMPLFEQDSEETLALIAKGICENTFGSTDCSLPMLFAQEHKIDVDVFMMFTDSETNCNQFPPSSVLRNYRKVRGLPAKLVVNAMKANNISIADPKDPNQLDVCGFDSGVPQILTEFMR